MKTYTFYWLSGEREVLEGTSIANAFYEAGYDSGALRALDFVLNGDVDDYVWEGGKWISREFGA